MKTTPAKRSHHAKKPAAPKTKAPPPKPAARATSRVVKETGGSKTKAIPFNGPHVGSVNAQPATPPKEPRAPRRKKGDPKPVDVAVAPVIGSGSKTVTKYLPVPMDAARVLATGRDLVSALDRLDNLDLAMAKMKADHKKSRETLMKDVQNAKSALRSGMAEVGVECREVPDWDRGIVQLIRVDRKPSDPDAVVDTRVMTDGERQVGFSFPAEVAKNTLAQVAARAGEDPAAATPPASTPPPAKDEAVPPKKVGALDPAPGDEPEPEPEPEPVHDSGSNPEPPAGDPPDEDRMDDDGGAPRQAGNGDGFDFEDAPPADARH